MATQTQPRHRDYVGPDWYLEERSQLLHDLAANDQADLVAIDPEIISGFITDMQDAIDACINVETGATVRAELKGKTEVVVNALKACGLKYDEVIYYAGMAFGKRSVILQEFGKGKEYDRAIHSQPRMFQFMTTFHQKAEKYKTELIAVGYTQLKIDDILTVRDALGGTNAEQNSFKAERPVLTQERIGLYNELYKIDVKVMDAAQQAFIGNPAKLGEYVYHPPVHHRGHIVIELDVPASSVVNIDTSSVDNFDIDVVQFYATDSDFVVYAAPANNSEPGPIFLQANDGQAVAKTPDELIALLGLNETDHFINAKNTGANAGHLQVTFVKKKN